MHAALCTPEIKLLNSHGEERKTTEGVVAGAVIVHFTVCQELRKHIMSHLRWQDHSTAGVRTWDET